MRFLAILFCLVSLITACTKSKEQAVQDLQKLSLKLDGDDFVRAAEADDLKAFQLFLTAGFDVNTPNSDGVSALMVGAQNGRANTVKSLIEHHGNVDYQGKNQLTALMLAAQANRLDVVKLLLQANANPNLQDASGWTALMKAVYRGNTECVRLIADRSREGVNKGLLIAALMGHLDTAKLLLDYGAEVDTRADDGTTALMLAASKGNRDLVSLLLKSGADPTLADKSGVTAASIAREKGETEMVDMLRQVPAPALATNRVQSTASALKATPELNASPVLNASPAAETASTVKTPSALDIASGGNSGALTPNPSSRNDQARKTDQDLLSQPSPSETISAAQSPSAEVDKAISVLDIQESFLPVTLVGVTGTKAKLEPVGGKAYSVSLGDELHGLSYKVIELEKRSTEDKDGNPVDVSQVRLRNTKTGETLSLVRGVPAQERSPSAELASDGSAPVKVQTDQSFSFPTEPNHTYKVLDIRPNQVIVKRLEDDKVLTLKKSP